MVRSAALVLNHQALSADPDAYREIARGLALCKTFGIVSFASDIQGSDSVPVAIPTAFRPPLYPWVLSWFTEPDGSLANQTVAFLHLFFGLLTVGMTFLIARRILPMRQSQRESEQTPRPGMPLNPERRLWAASFAAILVMIDPLLIQSSSLVMTETLATLLATACWWLWLRLLDAITTDESLGNAVTRRVMGSGLLLGTAFSLAYLCRPTFIVWPALIGVYLVGWGLKRKSGRPLFAAIAMLLMVAITVGAWTARNLKELGHPVWATTHGGYTLLLGNNPPFYEHLRTTGASKVPFWRQNWDPQYFFERWEERHEGEPRAAAFWERNRERAASSDLGGNEKPAVVRGELAEDRLAYETAKALIQRDPQGFLLACRWRWERLLSPLPLQTGDRPSKMLLAVGGFYTLTFLLVFSGLWRLRYELAMPEWAPAITLCVALAAVHTIYWTDMRMRAPAVPVLSILAAASMPTRLFGTRKIA